MILEAALPASDWPYLDFFFFFFFWERIMLSAKYFLILDTFKLIVDWVLEALFSSSLQD